MIRSRHEAGTQRGGQFAPARHEEDDEVALDGGREPAGTARGGMFRPGYGRGQGLGGSASDDDHGRHGDSSYGGSRPADRPAARTPDPVRESDAHNPDPGVRKDYASGNVTAKEVESLAVDPDTGVRLALASNERARSVNRAMIDAMAAADSSWRVRQAAKRTIRG